MKTKPYPRTEEKPMVLEEPVVAYQCTDPAVYRAMPFDEMDDDAEADAAFEAFMNSDLSELDDGFRLFTWEEARQWIARAEENIAAGRVVASEQLHIEMERKCRMAMRVEWEDVLQDTIHNFV